MTSFTVPPGVQRWLRGRGFFVDSSATAAIASSRNLTFVVKRRGGRALAKIAATPDDPWSSREQTMLRHLDGGTGSFATPVVVEGAPGRFIVSWFQGSTTYARRRAKPQLAIDDDARIGEALAHFHAAAGASKERVSGELIERLIWTTPEDYAGLGPASLSLWRLVQSHRSAQRRLTALLTLDRTMTALCHGDLRQANVFVHRGRVGFVDLELAGLGDPARDLGMWIAEDLGSYLVPRDPSEATTLPQLRARLSAFMGAWAREAAVLELPGQTGHRERAIAWAGEALLRRIYTVTFHAGAWGEPELHVTRSALGLLTQPRFWARHFLGAR